MVQRFSLRADGDKQLSKNFKVREFACKDGSDPILIDLNLIPIIQILRDKWGPGNINSAYRHLLYNRSIGSGDTSRHVQGKAVDIRYIDTRTGGRTQVPPREVAAWFEYLGFRGVGEYRTFTHGDTGPRKATWFNYGRETLRGTHLTDAFPPPVSASGIITASALRVRELPTTNAPILTTLPRDTSASIDVVYEKWGKLHGIPGWIHLDYFEEKKDPDPIATGDKVTVSGRGWGTSFKTGTRTQFYTNQPATVVAVHEGRAAPYQITVDPRERWTTGFFDEEQVNG